MKTILDAVRQMRAEGLDPWQAIERVAEELSYEQLRVDALLDEGFVPEAPPTDEAGFGPGALLDEGFDLTDVDHAPVK